MMKIQVAAKENKRERAFLLAFNKFHKLKALGSKSKGNNGFLSFSQFNPFRFSIIELTTL